MAAAQRGGIFTGVRILEFGSGAAGPLATRYFTEQGAAVVRLESAKRPDFLRLLHVAGAGDPQALNKAPMFTLINPDKKSVTLDLSRPEGVDLAKRLVGWADVVSENFAPGVMERFGLDYPRLRVLKPDLVMVSSCLFGQTGPQRDYPGFGGQGAAISGFNHLTGEPDSEAHGPYGTITDTLSPRYVALLIAAALLDRRRTGRGRYIDLSQIETGVYTLSELLVRQSANGRSAERRGNRSEHAAPHNAYPAAGEDRWLVIAIHSDEEWARLRRTMGDPEWARDPRYVNLAGRQLHEAELDERMGAWTGQYDAHELMERLQAAGVAAGVVQDCADLLSDPQLAHRGHFQQLPHTHLGELPFDRAGFRLSEHPGGFDRAAPDLGEHSLELLRELLGLSDAAIERLQEDGVVY